jgi:hypothetical protein
VIAGDAAVAVDPAVDAAVAEATPVAAKTAAPTGEAVEKAPSEVAGKKRAAQADKPADVKAETTSDSKTATTAASPDRGASATKPAADAEPAVQTAASRPGDPTVNAAKRDTETPDSTPKLTAAQASPDATLNSTALPAPAVAHAPLHVAQASTHQPGASDAIPVAGLAVEIAAHAQNGKNHFEIRLDPPELGRIDVRLDIDSDGQVTSHLRVERAETLDLLRRDAPSLERALQQAGLKTSDSGLQFSLRDQSFSQREQGRDMPAMARIVVPDDKLAPVETQRHYGRLASLGSGVDIRV